GLWAGPQLLELLTGRFKSRDVPALWEVALSEDGRLLATVEGIMSFGAGPYYSIHVWEVATGTEITGITPAKDRRQGLLSAPIDSSGVARGFHGTGCAVAFSRDGWRLFCAHRQLWDV